MCTYRLSEVENNSTLASSRITVVCQLQIPVGVLSIGLPVSVSVFGGRWTAGMTLFGSTRLCLPLKIAGVSAAGDPNKPAGDL